MAAKELLLISQRQYQLDNIFCGSQMVHIQMVHIQMVHVQMVHVHMAHIQMEHLLLSSQFRACAI